jgi:hypothetical protein
LLLELPWLLVLPWLLALPYTPRSLLRAAPPLGLWLGLSEWQRLPAWLRWWALLKRMLPASLLARLPLLLLSPLSHWAAGQLARMQWLLRLRNDPQRPLVLQRSPQQLLLLQMTCLA